MDKPLVIVSGANGQLGKALRQTHVADDGHRYLFFGRDDLPLENMEMVREVMKGMSPAYFINCAAYTAVDKAETERDAAFLVNGEAPGWLAAVCKEQGVRFVHISTDYVFDGGKARPYLELDQTHPICVYGASKLEGEKRIMQNDPDAVIIRTSWLYSEFGKNFVRTMVSLMKERLSIKVVDDQWGSPTYAMDLAQDIVALVRSGIWEPGVYHYSNEGSINWYMFAQAIKEITKSSCVVEPIPAELYPTPARRPAYSVLNTDKFTRIWGIRMRPWEVSLEECLSRLA